MRAKSSLSTLALALALAGCYGNDHSSGRAGTGAGAAPPTRMDDGVMVVGGWQGPEVSQEMTLPWTIEADADVMAIGKVGEPLERDDRQLLSLTLTEVLWGEAEVGELFPEDDAPFFGCMPPETIPRPSEQFLTYPETRRRAATAWAV